MGNQKQSRGGLFRSYRDRRVPPDAFIGFDPADLEQSVVDRFESQVVRSPRRYAVITREGRISYDELNNRANRVARILIEKGEKEKETVALFLGHGISQITAMLGVLKAGKIYVPLDPSYPEARTAYIVQDSQAGLIVTDGGHERGARHLAAGAARVINIDERGAESGDNLDLSISPDDLAYILYTSGSTGQPKGVVQNHRNLLHIVMLYTNDIHICREDRLSFLYSYGFSAGVKDVYGALLNGAAVCPWDIKEDGVSDLPGWLIETDISVYHSVPTVFRQVCGEISEGHEFPRLRLISCGSEPVTGRELELYKKHFPDDCLFHIELGATEIGVICQCFLDKESTLPIGVAPVGFPVGGKDVTLLDDGAGEAGIGRVGQITVRSRYLSPGYWNRPDLTRDAFHEAFPGADDRIYMTGDLGRLRRDGAIEYLGRRDFQVKVRGQRVEIAEIEGALAGLDSLREVAVIPRENRFGDADLVAYCVPASRPAPSIEELRRSVAGNLPDYMIPSGFVMLAALPMTPNGKIDRLELVKIAGTDASRRAGDLRLQRPAEGAAEPQSGHTVDNESDEITPPGNPLERVLADIFARLLDTEEFGIHDNFLQMGGHSLTAVQLRSRIRSAFQVDLPLSAIFGEPTVAGIARMLTRDAEQHDRIMRAAGSMIGDSALSDTGAESSPDGQRRSYHDS